MRHHERVTYFHHVPNRESIISLIFIFLHTQKYPNNNAENVYITQHK